MRVNIKQERKRKNGEETRNFDIYAGRRVCTAGAKGLHFRRRKNGRKLREGSIIHLRWRRGTSTLMGGGNDYGASDDADTLKALQTLDEILQGLPKMIQSSLSLQGVLSVKTVLDRESMKNAGADFEDRIKTSKTGIVAIGLDAGSQTRRN